MRLRPWIGAGLFVAALGCKSQPEVVARPSVTSATVQTKKPVTEADLGMPFYPGSIEKGTSSNVMETLKDRTVYSDRTAADDVKLVAEFYKRKLAGGHADSLTPSVMAVTGSLKDGSMVMIEVSKSGPKQTEIGITVHLNKRRLPNSGPTS